MRQTVRVHEIKEAGVHAGPVSVSPPRGPDGAAVTEQSLEHKPMVTPHNHPHISVASRRSHTINAAALGVHMPSTAHRIERIGGNIVAYMMADDIGQPSDYSEQPRHLLKKHIVFVLPST